MIERKGMSDSTADQIAEVIREFPFHDYGMDEVDPRSEYAEWVPALAAGIAAHVGAGDVPDGLASLPSRTESGPTAIEVSEEAPGTLGLARGRRRAARLLRSAARNIQGMHPKVAQEWLLSTADSFEKAAVEAEWQSAEDS
jgi:hypothetical protein